MPGSVQAFDGALWPVCFGDQRVLRVDPTSGAVDDVAVPGSPSDIAVVGDELWVTVRDREAVDVIDPVAMRVVDSIDVGPNPHKVIAAFGWVWVTNEGDAVADGTVSRIDPATRAEVQPRVTVGLAPIELAAGGERVYVANFNGRGLDDRPGTVTILAPT